MIGAACAGLLGLGLPTGSAWAQDVPGARCIAAVHAEFGGVTALRAQCTPGHDCMYQAPAGNASALSLLNSMAARTETCWLAAGLSMQQEKREQRGVVRTYARPGQTCKMLLSISIGTLADGYRAACQGAAR
jgi:hypothetical protein